MNVDVRAWAKSCLQCQRCKVQRHTSSSLSAFPHADRFSHLHIDVVGPLPTSPEGFRYLVTMIDRATSWPEAVPTDDTSAESVAKIVYEHWITRFGSAVVVSTDQGRNFESRLFVKLLNTMGTQRIRTCAYHPESNGKIERWHRSLKTSLKARLSIHSTWISELPTVLMGLRAAVLSDTGVSAAELTYGSSLRLPCDFFTTSPTNTQDFDSDFVSRLRTTINSVIRSQPPSLHTNKKPIFVHQDLQTCDQVFIRNDGVKKSLQPADHGPYKVLERDSKNFKLQLPERRSAVVSIDRLKPAYTVNELPIESNRQEPTIVDTSMTVKPQNMSKTEEPKQIKPILKKTKSGRISKLPVRFH